MQSLDLARISTVQSTDFMDFMAILRFSMGDLFLVKSSSGSEDSSSSLSGCQFDGENRDCLLHNLCSSDKLGLADGVSEISSQNTVRSECGSVAKICISDFTLVFCSIHLVHMKSSHFWGEILRFPSKSLDKSSDCADFTKSMDLSDYLRTLKFSYLTITLIKFTSLNLNHFVRWISGN